MISKKKQGSCYKAGGMQMQPYVQMGENYSLQISESTEAPGKTVELNSWGAGWGWLGDQ